MVYEFDTPDAWGDALRRSPVLEGFGSPGPVADYLGISRSAVYKLVYRGKLDMVRIRPPLFHGVGILMITRESVDRYVRTAGTSGRRPSRQSQMKLLKDRLCGAG